VIEVHIEELVLHGFTPGNRHEIADALRQRLVQLLSGNEFPTGARVDHRAIDAGSFQVTPGERGAGIGTRVAQSVYRGLSEALPLNASRSEPAGRKT